MATYESGQVDSVKFLGMPVSTSGKIKILILCVGFPPLNRIGATRPYTWAYHLGKYNDVKVLTPKKTILHGPLNYQVKKGNYETSEYGGVIYWLLTHTSFLSRIFIKCHNIMWCFHSIFSLMVKKERYDVIISTYSTWHCHFLGYFLKKLKIGKRWLADYRDLWNNNSHRDYKSKIFREISLIFEKRFLNNADVITSVSEPLINDLKNHLQADQAVYKCIYNGFDNHYKINTLAKNKLDPIIFTHTGIIYKNYRDPSLLFQAIQNLTNRKEIDQSRIKIRFVGDIIGNVKELAKKYEVENIIEVTGQVDRNMSLEYQRNSDFLMLLNPGDEKNKGIVTGKLFEYLSTGVPVVGIGFSEINVAGKILVETGSGKMFTEVEKLEKFLIECTQNKKLNWFNPDQRIINQYSSEKQTEILQDLIYTLT